MAIEMSSGNVTRTRVRTPGKIIISFLFAPVAIIAVGAGVWLNTTSERSYRAALEYRKLDTGQKQAYYSLPEVLVDLKPDQNGEYKFLKAKITIALGSERADDAARRIEANKPAIVDRLTLFMRELHPEDFDGSEAMIRIKAETARRINLIVDPLQVGEVLFENLAIQ